jgi:hypothetical protein
MRYRSTRRSALAPAACLTAAGDLFPHAHPNITVKGGFKNWITPRQAAEKFIEELRTEINSA